MKRIGTTIEKKKGEQFCILAGSTWISRRKEKIEEGEEKTPLSPKHHKFH